MAAIVRDALCLAAEWFKPPAASYGGGGFA